MGTLKTPPFSREFTPFPKGSWDTQKGSKPFPKGEKKKPLRINGKGDYPSEKKWGKSGKEKVPIV